MNGQMQRSFMHVQAAQPGATAAVWSSSMASPHQASGSGSAEVWNLLLRHAEALLVEMSKPACLSHTHNTPSCILALADLMQRRTVHTRAAAEQNTKLCTESCADLQGIQNLRDLTAKGAS